MNTDKIYAEAIANEYAPKETSKVKALKRLDRKAKSAANIFGYTFGVIMALVLGTGMCLSMGVMVLAAIQKIIALSPLNESWWQEMANGAMLGLFLIIQKIVLARKNKKQ